jgi:hypothetical protein
MPDRFDANTIKAKIEELVQGVGNDKSICPSQVARALSKTDWPEIMPLVRRCADELQAKGTIQITQRGKTIPSAEKATGPIRLKMRT